MNMTKSEQSLKESADLKISLASQSKTLAQNVKNFENDRDKLEDEVSLANSESRKIRTKVMEVERISKKDKKEIDDIKLVLDDKSIKLNVHFFILFINFCFYFTVTTYITN